jgi:hypothetical protein
MPWFGVALFQPLTPEELPPEPDSTEFVVLVPQLD